MKLVYRCLCLLTVVVSVVGCDLAGDWPDRAAPAGPVAPHTASAGPAAVPGEGSGDGPAVAAPAAVPPTPAPEDGLAVTQRFLDAINRLVRDARPAPPAAVASPFACALAAPESPERDAAESRYESYIERQERSAEEQARVFDELMGDRWV